VSYLTVIGAMAAAAARAGRDASDVTLVVVSKGRAPTEIGELYDMGHRDFGENRAQELVEKAAMLPGDIRWHFVGSLQTNKVRLVRPITSLLHSMDRGSLAEAWVKGMGLPPPVLVQVNLAGETQKSGVAPEGVAALVESIASLGIPVTGLMTIPPIPDTPEASRPYFRRLRQMTSDISTMHPTVTQTSMGMTDDYEVAIEEGATIIRVGRAIFE
jgi:pyridoxal phosphate enzyme (YggS family)